MADDFSIYRENMEALDEAAGAAKASAERVMIMFRRLTRKRDEARERISELEGALRRSLEEELAAGECWCMDGYPDKEGMKCVVCVTRELLGTSDDT